MTTINSLLAPRTSGVESPLPRNFKELYLLRGKKKKKALKNFSLIFKTFPKPCSCTENHQAL